MQDRKKGHLEVVGAHEQVCDALALHSHDPLIKILGLGGGSGICHLGICYSSQAFDLRIIVFETGLIYCASTGHVGRRNRLLVLNDPSGNCISQSIVSYNSQ